MVAQSAAAPAPAAAAAPPAAPPAAAARDEEVGDDFGQHIDLCQRLAEILRNYPENSIIKELVQNADDAQAEDFAVIIDHRSHPTEGLLFPDVGEFQGPALLSYNSGVFTDEDLQSIQQIGGSLKRGNVAKTGRFGIGFNSVYHATDLPSFVTGTTVCYFDPHCRHLPRGGDPTGRRLDWSKEQVRRRIAAHPAQFKPYELFGCELTAGKRFGGTLFRLPLRTREQAARSRLCKVPYTEEMVRDILQCFRAEAPSMLLFLKHVARISLYEISEGATEPRLLFAASIANAKAAAPQRSLVGALPRVTDPAQRAKALAQLQLRRSCVLQVRVESAGGGVEEQTWAVEQSTGAGAARRMVADPSLLRYGMQLLPWGGAACRVGGAAVDGRAFCFLPLPVETGLPVHLNGYFELSSTRRDVWWGSDLTGEGRLRAEWNRVLLQDVIPQGWLELIRRAIGEASGKAASDDAAGKVYALYPPERAAAPAWEEAAGALWRQLRGAECLWCGSAGWRRPADTLAYRGNQEGDGGAAQPPTGAVIAALRKAGLPVAAPPRHAAAALEAPPLTPAAVCRHLAAMQQGTSQRRVPGAAAQRAPLTAEEATAVLEWCLSGISPHRAKPSAYHFLVGAPLLPLYSGGVVRLASHGGSAAPQAILYSEVAKELFGARLPARLTAPECSGKDGLAAHFASEALRSALAVSELTPAAALALVPEIYPALAAPAVGDGALPDADVAWLDLLWDFLSTAPQPALRAALPSAEGWALLPLAGGGACRLVRQDADSVRCIARRALDPRAEAALAQAGCHLVSAPPVDALVPDYVAAPTPPGVLRALHRAAPSFGPAAADGLREWLSESHHAVDPRTDLWRVLELRIWGCYGDEEGVRRSAVRDDCRAALLPAEIESPLGALLAAPVQQWHGRLLRCGGDAERELLRRAGLRQVSPAAWWLNIFLPAAPAAARAHPAGFREAARLLLCSTPALGPSAPGLVEKVRDAALIPDASEGEAKQLRAATDLFDPRASELRPLLTPAHFADPEFATGELLPVLVSLGMRVSLDREAVLELAQELSSAADEARGARAAALLRYVDRNLANYERPRRPQGGGWGATMGSIVEQVSGRAAAEEDAERRFFAELRRLPWLPCLTAAPEALAPFPSGSSAVLRRATDARPRSDMWLCSATRGVLALPEGAPCADLRRHLGWQEAVPPEVLTQQLAAFAAGVNAALQGDGAAAAAVTANRVVLQLYSALEQHRDGSLGGAGADAVARALKPLKDQPLVWTGERFAAGAWVAQRAPSQWLPGLHLLPATLHGYVPLLRLCGLRAEFAPQDFVVALQRIAEQGEALQDEQLQSTIAVANQLARDPGRLSGEVPLPDEKGVLRPPSELLYDDMPWDPLVAGAPELEGRSLGHPLLAQSVAERLGVTARRMLVLAREGASGWELGMGSDAEVYGQHERITSRIAHILQQYPDGTGILFELIQNADDAGAHDVALMLDKTTYGTASLLKPTLQAWQGPALYCFNDSAFTAADFAALANIGQGKKLQDLGKTGRFGLGFNAVYHFTDLPSFVSAGSLVMLDPHVNYLPGAQVSAPGLKLRVPSKLFEQFPDQFAPYKHFGCTLGDKYSGTLFRFPLRTPQTAERSEIRKQAYSLGDIEALFAKFRAVLLDAPLFLKNVRKVRALVREEGAEPRELFSVHLAMDAQGLEQRTALARFVAGTRDRPLTKDAFLQRLRDTRESELPQSQVAVHLVGRFSDGPPPCAGPSAQELPAGEQHTAEVHDQWIVSSAIGGGTAKALALSNRSNQLRLVPWAGVAVHSSRDSAPPTQQWRGRAYTFLPLPAETGLPWHVNGAFELSSNRRNIWFGDDLQGESEVRSRWNVALLQCAAAPAAALLLLQLKGQPEWPVERYYSLFPPGGLQAPWSLLGQEVYRQLWRQPVLWTTRRGGQWVAPCDALFADPAAAEEWPQVHRVLLELGHAVAMPPPHVAVQFKEAIGEEAQVRRVDPATLRAALRQGPRPRLEVAQAVELLRYAASDLGGQKGEGFAALAGLPLVPLCGGRVGDLLSAASADASGLVFICSSPAEKQLLEPRCPQRVVDIAQAQEGGVRDILSDPRLQAETNVRKLVPAHIPSLLESMVDPGLRGRQSVPAGDPVAPPLQWLGLLWRYLAENSVQMMGEITAWPIVPTREGPLLPFIECGRVVDVSAASEGDGADVVPLLTDLGLLTLHEQAAAVRHADLVRVVRPLTAAGVADALRSAHQADVGAAVEHGLAPTARRRLLRWLARPDWAAQLERRQVDTIAALPLFTLCGQGEGTGFAALSAGGGGKYIPPDNVPPHLLRKAFVDLGTDAPRDGDVAALLRAVGLGQPSEGAFYAEHFLPALDSYDPQERDRATAALADRAVQLSADCPVLDIALRRTAWVPSPSGELHRPDELYHPEVKGRELLPASSKFPRSDFTEPHTRLEAVSAFGLRRELGTQAVAESALQLAEAPERDADPGATAERARALLHYFSVHLDEDSERDAELVARLAKARWLPVLDGPKDPALPPLGREGGRLMAPHEVRPAADAALCSHAYGLLAADVPPRALGHWGWDKPLRAQELVLQLIKMSHHCTRTGRSAAALPAVTAVYEELQRQLTSDSVEQCRVAQDAIAGAVGEPIVWVGSSFARPDQIAFLGSEVLWGNDGDPEDRGQQNALPPFLYCAPPELMVRFLPEGDLFELADAMGIREQFEPKDYAGVLVQLGRDRGSEPLSRGELGLAARLVAHVAQNAPEGLRGTVPLPDARGVMGPPEELAYNDVDWESSGEGEGRTLHPDISREWAQKLGVQSLRDRLMSDRRMTGERTCPTEPVILRAIHSERGANILQQQQGRRPQTQMRRLVNDMLEVVSVSGARVVGVVYDKRTRSSQRVMPRTEQMHAAPALCWYLDRVLSHSEIDALMEPGAREGHKQGPRGPLTCGAGLLTAFAACDFLQILSGGELIVWDPLGRVFSPEAAARAFKSAELCAKFPGQLSVFDTASERAGGTAIRMPLRQEPSPLGPAPTSRDVHAWLQQLSGVLPQAAPLAPSLQDLTVSIAADAHPEPRQFFRLSVEGPEERGNIWSDVTWHASGGLRLGFFDRRNPPKAFYEVCVRSTVDHSTADLVDAEAGDNEAAGDAELERLQEEAFQRDDFEECDRLQSLIDRRQKRAAAPPGSPVRSSSRWAVSFSCAAGKSWDLGNQQCFRNYGLQPLGGVAAQLELNGSLPRREVLEMQGMRVCSCPISGDGSTGLPVTIYANQIMLSGQALPGVKDQDRQEWNSAVLGNVARAYGMLLERLCSESRPTCLQGDIGGGYRYWPCTQGEPGRAHYAPGDLLGEQVKRQVVQPLYERMASKPVFLLRGKFARLSDATVASAKVPTRVQDILSRHVQLFSIPTPVCAELRSRVQAQEYSCQAVRDLCTAGRPTCQKVIGDLHSPEDVAGLLEYATHDLSPQDGSRLRNVQLLPLEGVGGDGCPPVGVFDHAECFDGDGTARALIPKKRANFLHPVVGTRPRLRELFDSEQFRAAVGVRRLTAEVLSRQMHSATPLPPEWEGRPAIPAHGWQGPVRDWIQHFWTFIQARDLRRFREWPLLPLSDGTLGAASLAGLAFVFDPAAAEKVEAGAAGGDGGDDDARSVASAQAEAAAVAAAYASDGEEGPCQAAPLPPGGPAHADPAAGAAGGERRGPGAGADAAAGAAGAAPPPPAAAAAAGLGFGEMFAAALGAIGFGRQEEEQPAAGEDANYDPSGLRPVVEAIQCPIVHDSVARKLRLLQPQGSPQAVVLTKLRGLRGVPEAVAGGAGLAWHALSPEGRRALAAFFAAAPGGCASYSTAERKTLRELPVFETLADAGEFTSLAAHDHCLTAPADNEFFVPPGPQWVRDTHPEMLDALGVRRLSAADVWREHLVPRMPQLPAEERHAQLLALRDGLRDPALRGDDRLNAALRKTTLVPSRSGQLLAAHRLMDPRIKLVQDVFGTGEGAFPEERYCDPQWLEFLEQVGMKAKVDAAVFLECARRVHQQRDPSAAVSEDLARKAGQLAELAVEKFDYFVRTAEEDRDLGRDGWLRALRELCVVPAPAVGGATRLWRFSECSLPDDAPLVCFAYPTLPASCTPGRARLADFGVESPPRLSAVCDSLCAVSEVALESYPLRSTPTQDAAAVFAYLSRRRQEHSGSREWQAAVRRLRSASWIPVTDSVPARPDRCFHSARRQLPPYVMQLPREYEDLCPELLAELGVRGEATAADYVRIVKEVGGERRASRRPISARELCSFSAMLEIIAEEQAGEVAWVPDDDAVLCPRECCVYNDAPWLLSRVRPRAVSLVHPRLGRDLCQKLHISTVQQVIEEELDPAFEPVCVNTEEAAALTARLTSDEFAFSLLELLEHQRMNAFGMLSFASVTRALHGVQVVLVDALRTRLFLSAGYADRPKRDDVTASQEGCHYFVDRPQRRVYIARLPPPLRIDAALARCVASIFQLPAIPFLGDLLSCDPKSMSSQLSLLQIRGGDAAPSAQAQRGTPGAELCAEDAAAALLRPLRRHVAGDVVAWEDAAGARRYGELLRTETQQQKQGEVPAMCRHLVRVGPTVTKWLGGAEVWMLRSADAQDAATAAPGGPAPLAAEDGAGGAAAAPGDAAGGAGDAAGGRADGAERDELVSMLTSLMKKVDLPVNMEQEAMMEKVVRLTRDLDGARARADQAERALKHTRRDAEELERGVQCPICLSAKVNLILTPCGHVLCSGCRERMQPRGGQVSCPMCRREVTEQYPVFI
eukprot:TRINITY_DN25176_c0_g1_i1.p1 TRINITY_DN25176_c0_g1~~TRINITY_DN25176_c0_g1_i1.p1  ORF type:complete len:4799 (+),score=1553.05 TRINITY_DN25176_c0_g1_i1:126-14399(+)